MFPKSSRSISPPLLEPRAKGWKLKDWGGKKPPDFVVVVYSQLRKVTTAHSLLLVRCLHRRIVRPAWFQKLNEVPSRQLRGKHVLYLQTCRWTSSANQCITSFSLLYLRSASTPSQTMLQGVSDIKNSSNHSNDA